MENPLGETVDNEYDGVGDLRFQTASNGGGRVKTRTDQNGDVTAYTYDDLHRLVQRRYTVNSGSTYPAVQPPDTFTYDRASRLLTATNDANTTVLPAPYTDTFTYQDRFCWPTAARI